MKISAAIILTAVVLAAVVPAAHAATKSFGVSQQALTINGIDCPELVSWSGGDPSAVVVVDSATKKHIGNPAYEPIVMVVGLPQSPALLNSLADLFANRASPLSFLLTHSEGTQLQVTNAVLIEARFPPLEATSKEPWRLTLVFHPQSTHAVSGGTPAPAGPVSKKAFSSNFRFNLSGLPGTVVRGVAGFTVTRASAGGVGADRIYSSTPGPTQIPDLSVNLVLSGATAWVGWRDNFIVQGNAGDTQEKSGSLELMGAGPESQTVLLTLQLSHVGIKRLARVVDPEGVAADRFQAELYCEGITLASGPVAGTNAPTDTPKTPDTPPAETAPSNDKAPEKEPTKTPATSTETAPAETAPADGKPPAGTKIPAKEPQKTPETAPVPAAVPATNAAAATNSADKGPRDPADFPRAKDTTRTQFSAVKEIGFLQETANYTAKAKSDALMAFYEQELKGRGWEETARYENNNGTERAHQIITTWKKDTRTAALTFMDTASGHTEIQVVVQERK